MIAAGAPSFWGELQHLQGLRHPLVVALEGAFVEGDRAFLVMPCFRLGSLRPWAEALKERKGGLNGHAHNSPLIDSFHLSRPLTPILRS